MEYKEFLKTKQHSSIDYGIKPTFYPDGMFDYQKYVTEMTIKKGRYANFLDTGTGKTLIELTIAHNYVKATNKPALIITPLAVADQHLRESEKFGIEDVEHTKNGKYSKKIILINYERLHYMDSNDFDCVILDESSILKNFDGAFKQQITSFLKRVKYRYLFTATPSPNDFVELGTSSEALGYLGYTDMLTKFFTNNEDTIKPQNIGTKWILKGHATDDFFKWVSSWSISMRKPSDLGFSDVGYELPELITNYHSVKNKNNLVVDGQIQLFNQIARRLTEIKQEQRQTIEPRCEQAVEIANNHDTSVYWCNFNKEGDLLKELDKNSYQITGSMKLEKKEEMLLAFAKGDIKKLITKARMTGFGLNWQHCGHTVFFPSFSYEQYYQAIRRFWRFGRTEPVVCDLVYSDGQKRVLDSLIAKADKANQLFSKLNTTLHSDFKVKTNGFNQKINLPTWM